MIAEVDHIMGFPGGSGVKNPPANAGNAGSIPGQSTRTQHAAAQLSLCSTPTELTHSGARVPQLEGPCVAVKDLA